MADPDAMGTDDGIGSPKRVANFELLSVIGSGGMGLVYRARDLKLGREVALKRPRPDLAARDEFRKRFVREGRTSSKLLHPHITAVFEAFEEDGVPWLVMELVDGQSLRKVLQRQRVFPVLEAVAHLEGLTDALREAHSKGVLHRDINPNNILIGNDGRARLTDFGLAKAFGPPDQEGQVPTESTLSQTGDGMVGTRGYISPEQALGRPADPRSELFALGVVMYEMCTGRQAFRSESGSWLDHLLHGEPEPMSRLNYEVPQEYERIVRKAIAKRTDERYQSAAEMLADVRALRRRLESGADMEPARPRPARRLRWWHALPVTAAIVVGAAAVRWLAEAQWSRNPFEGGTPRQLTSAPGWETEPALSPDGSFVAYSSNESGNPDIWLLDVEGGERIRLTDDPGSDRDPAWFPDGGSIAFVSDRSGQRSIWKVPRLGGSPVMIVPNAEDPAIPAYGDRIAFARTGPSGLLRIWVAPLDDPSRVTKVTGDGDGLWDHRDPTWSPDGETLCYAAFRNLWFVPASGGQARQLTTDHATDREPVWCADGRRILFSSRRGGTLALWSVPASGGRPRRLTMGTGPEAAPSVSREGSRLAYSTYVYNADVVVVDTRAGLYHRLPGLSAEGSPAVAPDGSAMVFASNRRGKFDLWLQQLDNGAPLGEPVQLTDHPGSAMTPTFSPDGRWIAYFRVLEGQRDIWIVARSAGLPSRFTEHTGLDIHPAYSPDGSHIAFASDRGGWQDIWVAPVIDGERAGDPRQVTSIEAADAFPAWSSDGRWIAYVSESEAWVTEVDSGRAARRVTHGAQAQVVKWDPSGQSLLVSGWWGTDRLHLRRVPLDGGDSVPFEPEIDFGDACAGAAFDLSADGRILAFGMSESTGNVWVMTKKGKGP